MKLLLDTCTCLWFAIESPELSSTATRLCLDPDVERFVSAASVWEIAIKYAKGRLALNQSPENFLVRLLDKAAAEVLPIDELAALHCGKLPPLHGDPFDRMLVAQSVIHGMTIVTPDPQVTQYAVRTLW